MIAYAATHPFTIVQVAISLAGIAAGFVVMARMIRDRPLGQANILFLAATIATTLTGFLFPIHGFDPALGVGIVSTLVLGVALWSLGIARLKGAARPAYAMTASAAFYLNMFVAIVQVFQKVPSLRGGDPAHPPPPFIAVQAATLVCFVIAGIYATRRFHAASL